MRIANMLKVSSFIGVVSLMLLTSCGSSDDTTTAVSSPASTYLVEYISGMMAASEGKTEFMIRVMKRSDGSLVTGLTSTGLSLHPTMYMNSGKSHATPVDSIHNNGDGTYSCTVYYLMASEMMMMGMPASSGHWELQVKIGTETATFYPFVAMAMSDNTPRGTLKGQSDIISTMTGTEKRAYYLFRDGLATGGTGTWTFDVFIAAKESMTNYPPVSGGTILTSPTGTWSVDTTLLSASTDLSTWMTGTDKGDGHWSIENLSGLTSGVTGTVYVSFTVNGEVKTTDGLASSGTNTYAAFTVTPQ